MLKALQQGVGAATVGVPRDLTHAIVFYTAGAAIQQVAPDHVPTADALGQVWLPNVIQQRFDPLRGGSNQPRRGARRPAYPGRRASA